MARRRSTYRILTLQGSLEEVMHLGEDYLVAEAWEEWRARHLLVWLKQYHPDMLSLPVALVLPSANVDGAVYAVDEKREPITELPFYRIERRRPIRYPR